MVSVVEWSSGTVDLLIMMLVDMMIKMIQVIMV